MTLEADIIVNKLLASLGDDAASYRFLIPGWEPQDSEVALRWIKSQIWEGFSTSYEINTTNKVVYLKSWEEDCD